MCVCVCVCVCSFSRPDCFHRNTGADPGVGARERCVCDPDDVQVRKTHNSIFNERHANPPADQ